MDDVDPFEVSYVSRDMHQDDRRKTISYVEQNRSKILGSHMDIPGFRPSMPLEDRGKYSPTPPRDKNRTISREIANSPQLDVSLPSGIHD